MLPSYQNKIKDIQLMITDLVEIVTNANKFALDVYESKNYMEYDKIKELLVAVPDKANKIDNEIVKTLALFGPEAHELRGLVAYLKMTNELVRVADGTKKYSLRMKELLNSDCDLSSVDSIVVQLHKTTINALSLIHECFISLDKCDISDVYRRVMVEESKNDDLFALLEKEILTDISHVGDESVSFVKALSTLRKLERGGDRCVNIANLMVFAKVGGEIKTYSAL